MKALRWGKLVSLLIPLLGIACEGTKFVAPSRQSIEPVLSPMPTIDGEAARIVIAVRKRLLYSLDEKFVSVDGITIASFRNGGWTDTHAAVGEHRISIQHIMPNCSTPKNKWWGTEATCHFEMRGPSVRVDLDAEKTYLFYYDFGSSTNEIVLNQVENWPDGFTLDPNQYVAPLMDPVELNHDKEALGSPRY